VAKSSRLLVSSETITTEEGADLVRLVKITEETKEVKMRKLGFLSIVVVLLAAVSLASCSDGAVFQQSKILPETGWHKDSVVTFEYEAADTAGVYDIVVDIRNNGSYKYQNFWLFISSTSPDGLVYSDSLECVLADFRGKWIGKGSGSLYHLPVSFMPQVKFPKQGVYKFNLIQGMREDCLLGINDIGIRVLKSEN
jgi:gliding motility-associated lipoprotein GldH